MLPKRWSIRPPAPPDVLAQYEGLSPLMAQVLVNRALSPSEAIRFLRLEAGDWDPFRLKGMHQAVARIRRAIRQQEQIAVYGDFDADGVTATVLLVQALANLGARVRPYIPHRIDEGYGLNSDALIKLRREGVRLVITVDCGIRSVQEVEDGKAAGLDIIITDHHSLGPELPDALAVINPKQDDCPYDEDMLAGVGLAYKLADALFRVARADRRSQQPRIELEDLVDLVAIGTVADLAPLNRLENRWLVRHGLRLMSDPKRPGLSALLAVAGTKRERLNTWAIGFTIGPRINAAGRLDNAMIAYNLLAARTIQEAQELALQLNELNLQRQEMTKQAQERIRAQIIASGEAEAPLIFVADSSLQPGIVGLVAGRLTEDFYRPTVILHEGETESRASCRSIPQFDITRALDQCADLLVRHGGHAQAAGFTILNENLPAFKERLMEIARAELEEQDLRPSLDIDAVLKPHDLSLGLCEELAQLEPVGHFNDTPVFVTRGLRVQDQRAVGKNGDHLKLRLVGPGTPPLDAIGFNLRAQVHHLPDCVDVAYELEINEYNGNRSVQLKLHDVRPASQA